MAITVAGLSVYPVKGMTAQALDVVTLDPDAGVPGDRRFAIALPKTAWDPAHPTWLKKESLVMLMRDAALARLRSHYDDATGTLSLHDGDRLLAREPIADAAGRARLEAALDAALGPRPDGSLRLIAAGPQSLTDVPQNFVSLLHLPSVRDFAARIGRDVDPARFRANVLLDGGAAWEEFDWLGQTIRIGAAVLRITKRVTRCAATHVDPHTAARDLPVVKLLKDTYGHVDMAVYAAVETTGAVHAGDVVTPPAVAGQSRLRTELGFYAGAVATIVKERFRR